MYVNRFLPCAIMHLDSPWSISPYSIAPRAINPRSTNPCSDFLDPKTPRTKFPNAMGPLKMYPSAMCVLDGQYPRRLRVRMMPCSISPHATTPYTLSDLDKKLPLRLLLVAVRLVGRTPSGNLVEEATIVNPSDVLLHHASIFRPQHQVRCQPFEKRTAPAYRICNAPLAFHHVAHVPYSNVIASFSILFEDVFELLRHEASFVVVGTAV